MYIQLWNIQFEKNKNLTFVCDINMLILYHLNINVLMTWLATQEERLSFSTPIDCNYCSILLHVNYIWPF
jgi:hypothetical protein